MPPEKCGLMPCASHPQGGVMALSVCVYLQLALTPRPPSHLQGGVMALCVLRFDWGEEALRSRSFVLLCAPLLAEAGGGEGEGGDEAAGACDGHGTNQESEGQASERGDEACMPLMAERGVTESKGRGLKREEEQ